MITVVGKVRGQQISRYFLRIGDLLKFIAANPSFEPLKKWLRKAKTSSPQGYIWEVEAGHFLSHFTQSIEKIKEDGQGSPDFICKLHSGDTALIETYSTKQPNAVRDQQLFFKRICDYVHQLKPKGLFEIRFNKPATFEEVKPVLDNFAATPDNPQEQTVINTDCISIAFGPVTAKPKLSETLEKFQCYYWFSQTLIGEAVVGAQLCVGDIWCKDFSEKLKEIIDYKEGPLGNVAGDYVRILFLDVSKWPGAVKRCWQGMMADLKKRPGLSALVFYSFNALKGFHISIITNEKAKIKPQQTDIENIQQFRGLKSWVSRVPDWPFIAAKKKDLGISVFADDSRVYAKVEGDALRYRKRVSVYGHNC